jgi:hypothetical protein
VFVFLSYNIVIQEFTNEPRKAAYLKEFQFIDRNDICYDKLDSAQHEEVLAFRTYHLMDKIHFTLKFYDDVSASAHKYKTNDLLQGISVHSFKSMLWSSYWNLHSVWFIVLLYLLTAWLTVFKLYGANKRYWVLVLFFTFFPILLCMYVLLPTRFLMPYYAVLSAMHIILLLHNNILNRMVYLYALIALVLLLREVKDNSIHYRQLEKTYKQTLSHLSKMSKDKQVVINEIDADKFFEINPFSKRQELNVVFLNLYYLAAFDCYADLWRNKYERDPFSLKDKVDYVIANNYDLIIRKQTLEYLQKYLKGKYNKCIVPENISRFDQELITCKIIYGDDNRNNH